MDVRSYKLDTTRNGRIRGNESGEHRKDSLGKEVEVVWECDEKRGALHRKEDDGLQLQGRRKRSRKA